MNALYRIVNALLAAVIFPIILLMDFIYFRIGTTVVEAGLHETLSIKDFIDIVRGDHTFSYIYELAADSDFSWPKAFDIINGRLIASGVCLALVVVVAIFIIVWSCCSNKRIPVIAASVAGLISTIVMMVCFSSASSVITNGIISVSDILDSGMLVSLIGNLVKIEAISLAGFQNGLIFTFIFLLVWSAAFYLIEIGEPKEEKTKK
ncbi:MAG: hypothetical protein IJD78_07595 [Clostridia bacterium]|nr:hypothetical protein [Clostridia bacterium]MBQ3007407.1 hypothetical protein [Clostridia bacterium]